MGIDIDWKQALTQLKSFQEYTLRIQAIDKQLVGCATRRAEALQRLAAVKDQLASKQAEKEGLEKTRRADEQEVEAEKVHLQEREAKLYVIKTNKEYQAGLKEVTDAKRLIKEREDRVIAMMEAIEKAAQEITQLSATCADTETECAKLLADLEAEVAAMQNEREREVAAVAEIGRAIPAEAMRFYKDAQRRFPDALAVVNAAGVCGGCNMRIPPQRFVELRQHKRLFDCPSCHRLLCTEE